MLRPSFSFLPHPAIIAHRGSSAHAPENTVAAFLLAVKHGADAVELDAKLTKDGQVVVIHDLTVDRTTGGTGAVKDLTLAELHALDAGSSFDSAFKGEPVPSLDEVFAMVGKKLPINVELTNYAAPMDRLPQAVALLVKKHNLEKHVFFSSFNPLALLKIRRLLPTCPIGLLAFPRWSGAAARSPLGRLIPHEALHPALEDVSPALILRTHQASRRLHVYTVNDPKDMRRMFDCSVDGIFTDDPLLAREILSQ